MADYHRQAGFSINLRDFVESDVVDIIPTKDYLETIHIEAISRMVMPDTKDPGCENPNLRPEVFIHNGKAGSSNKIVARLTLQANSLLEIFYNSSDERNILEEINTILCTARDDLLRAEEVCRLLVQEIEELNEKNSKVKITKDQVMPVNKVHNMDQRVKEFLTSLKSFLQNLIQIANPIFEVNIHSPHFHKLKKAISDKVPSDDLLVQLLDSKYEQQKFIEMIIGMRNALEHKSSEKEKLLLNNYEYEADGMIYEPQLLFMYQSLDKVVYKRQGLIREEFPLYIDCLLDFAENFYYLCISSKLNTKQGIFGQVCLGVEEIKDQNIDPKCPIKYKWHLQPREDSKLMESLKNMA